MNSYHFISGNTTLLTVDTYDVFNNKVIVLPYTNTAATQPSTGRLLYLKETTGIPEGSFSVSTASGTILYPSTHQINVLARQCLILQEFPVNSYNLMDGYIGLSSFSTMEAPALGSVAVSVDGLNSSLFVDLQTQSKTLLLPAIQSLSTRSSDAPYFLIKDVYGKAYTRPLFLSTTGGASIDGLGASIGLHYNYASIELVGDPTLNRWHIVNYYGGI